MYIHIYVHIYIIYIIYTMYTIILNCSFDIRIPLMWMYINQCKRKVKILTETVRLLNKQFQAVIRYVNMSK